MKVFSTGSAADGSACKLQQESAAKTTTSTGSPMSTVEKKKKTSVSTIWMMSGSCVRGYLCSYLHSWFYGDGLSKLVNPPWPQQSKLASYDETLRVRDCHTGQCGRVIKLAGEVGSLFSEAPWVFVAVPYVVKAWNTQNDAEFNLDGPVGLVQSMVVANDICSLLGHKFTERGRLFGRREVWKIQSGPGGVFFTGDEAGLMTVWKMACRANVSMLHKYY
ncbi:hypothetical protein TIFTF001_007114 [Ficus carica]|uniref:Uncharacterized protein n=1 Tax=Ficus carica TaxID=3494 RepID=A0AA87ZIR9_FICCA|nr:hypothetical protein TIFTF001_007114 [Ficus carica]